VESFCQVFVDFSLCQLYLNGMSPKTPNSTLQKRGKLHVEFQSKFGDLDTLTPRIKAASQQLTVSTTFSVNGCLPLQCQPLPLLKCRTSAVDLFLFYSFLCLASSQFQTQQQLSPSSPRKLQLSHIMRPTSQGELSFHLPFPIPENSQH